MSLEFDLWVLSVSGLLQSTRGGDPRAPRRGRDCRRARRRHGAAAEGPYHVAGAAVRTDGSDAVAHVFEDGKAIVRERGARGPSMRDRRVHAQMLAHERFKHGLNRLGRPCDSAPLPRAGAVAEAADRDGAGRGLLPVQVPMSLLPLFPGCSSYWTDAWGRDGGAPERSAPASSTG